jgi:hypothetical protein
MAVMTKGHRLAMLVAAAAATLLLAACGGSSGDDGLSRDGPDDAKRLAFLDCLRDAGVDVQTSRSGADEQVEIRPPRGISKLRMSRIQRDCARKTGGGPRQPTKAEQARFLDMALKFARCMRAHGIDIPDPKLADGGIAIGGPGKENALDPHSPAFQRAEEACASFLPKGKREGPK